MREQTTEEYLLALQKEYVCASIRKAIYPHQNDKDYFQKLMDKKKEKIVKVSTKYKLKNIFSSDEECKKVEKLILPSGELPNFVYNEIRVTKEQLKFPYTGTIVCYIVHDNEGNIKERDYGITERVNFERKTITIKSFSDLLMEIDVPIEYVERLSNKEADAILWKHYGHSFKLIVK